jgi:chromosome partitioning protein
MQPPLNCGTILSILKPVQAMIITVASFKGGVGKTTTALHLATYFQGKTDTLLVDGDLNRSALDWASRGELPFKVVDEKQADLNGTSHPKSECFKRAGLVPSCPR